MNWKTMVLIGCIVCSASRCRAQAFLESDWKGIWQAELDGQPSVTLTLADDAGKLAGTVVFSRFGHDEGRARILGQEPHLLLGVRVSDRTLMFQFKSPDRRLLDVTVARTAPDQATIHCENCGADAPIVNLVRAH
jgi:hypothetical protein